jgi:sigma-B regulation protein RsbU (phosphoserine phosphatase)
MTQRPWTVAVVQPRAQFDQPMNDLAEAQKWWTALMGLVAALGAAWITWKLLGPIRSLRAAAVKASEGDWSARAEVHGNDELGDLAGSFNAMMPALQERARMQDDLRVAREIQMGMLPHNFAGVERAYGVEFGAVLEPAREVGGDLYGVNAATRDRLVVFLGDVSGKGSPASMFMVRAISLARLLSREIVEPERILARLNDELAADNPSGMFVTFLCAVFEPASGRLTLANAGHCRPLLLRADRPPEWAVKNLGTALGFESGLEFERTELMMRGADVLVLYTDGVSEAFNPHNETFGNERLLEAAEDWGGLSAPAITASLLAKVRDFASGAPQSDDIAILTLKVIGASGLGASRVTLDLHATPDDVMLAVQRLQEFGQLRQVPEKILFGLTLALEECASNIVNHALRRDPRQGFRVTFGHTGRLLSIELRDRGPEFDPTQAPVSEKAFDDDDRPPGGWGIQLVRRYTDELRYAREADENVLRLIKRL